MKEWVPAALLATAGFLLAPLALVVAQPSAPCQQYGCEGSTTVMMREDTHEGDIAKRAFDQAQDAEDDIEGGGSGSSEGVLAAESDPDESSRTVAPDAEDLRQAGMIGESSGEVNGEDGRGSAADIEALPDTGGAQTALFGASAVLAVGVLLLLRTFR